MQRFVDHPAMGKTYEILIGGIAYPGQCRAVWERRDGTVVAECNYFNTGDPAATFKIEVDNNGKPV